MKWRGTLKSTILTEKTSKKPKTFSECVKKRPNYRPKNSKSQISNSKFQIPSADGQGIGLPEFLQFFVLDLNFDVSLSRNLVHFKYKKLQKSGQSKAGEVLRKKYLI